MALLGSSQFNLARLGSAELRLGDQGPLGCLDLAATHAALPGLQAGSNWPPRRLHAWGGGALAWLPTLRLG